jgi:preprotein translocase subunit YajC
VIVDFIPLLLLVGLFWLLLIRPQRRRAAAQHALQDTLEVGDEVLTVGGVYGTIRELSDDDAMLEIAPGTLVKVDRRAIAARPAEFEPDTADEQNAR